MGAMNIRGMGRSGRNARPVAEAAMRMRQIGIEYLFDKRFSQTLALKEQELILKSPSFVIVHVQSL
jgi:hypothetical protein